MPQAGGIGRLLTVAGALALAGVAVATTQAAAPTPTPGPAARAGKAIDKAIDTVGAEVSEALLVARVRIALLEHLKEDALGVHIDTKGADVTLTGTVTRRSSQELAGEVAGSVKGVRSVANRVALTVEEDGAKPGVAHTIARVEQEVKDALLEARVKARLIDQLGRVAFAIEVEATDGVVSLTGAVPDARRRDLARDVARSTKGVAELHDLLRVTP